MSKKINQLDPATDEEVANDSYLYAIADPTNGLGKKATVQQVKSAYGTKSYRYTATGETDTLTIPTLAGKDVLVIFRGVGVIYLSNDDTPESDEYKWDGVDILLGTITNTGEKFNILYV